MQKGKKVKQDWEEKYLSANVLFWWDLSALKREL